jgi:Domain of unknown function (DUF1992)
VPNWDRLAEQKIKDAMALGEFDNLPGAGRPQDLTDDASTPAEWRLAYRVLKNNNLALPWMERRKELEADRETLRARVLSHVRSAHGGGDPSELEPLRELASELNSKLRMHNVEVPLPQLQAPLFDIDREVAEAREA